MIFIDELYRKSIADNEKNLQFWENYLNELKSLNFHVYSEQLKIPVLVPIGSKIVFRGELKHTNEVTVSLGADYFVKCSTTQAEVLRQHRIKDAQTKIDLYRKEKEYLRNRISFTKENEEGHEILEVYSEEEEQAWRKKHRENVKKYKQRKPKEETKPKDDVSDSELWERLEELELQEELENELLDNYNEIVDKRKENTFLETEETMLRNSFKEEINTQKPVESIKFELQENSVKNPERVNEKVVVEEKTDNTVQKNYKLDLLQKVLDKQNELESKLHELKHRERKECKTERDLILRLDEMEQLDELEDDIERLDDILETEDVETEEGSIESVEDTHNSVSSKLKRSISFADDNDHETLEITFRHSDVEPNRDPFNPDKGILKPSDMYEAYSHFFGNKTTSILKKSKYDSDIIKTNKKPEIQNNKVSFDENEGTESIEQEDRTIVIRDVVENVGINQHNIEGGARPTSLFKKKRMQNKI